MKKIILLLALLIPSLAFATPGDFIYKATPAALGVTDGYSSPAIVDSFGRVQVVVVPGGGTSSESIIPISNATGLNGVGTLTGGAYRVSTPTLTTASTTTSIKITGIESTARVGDYLQMASGTAANIGAWAEITAVATNTLTLGHALPATPANADTAYLMRPSFAAMSTPGNTLGSALFMNLDLNYQNSVANGILKAEDAASASGDAGVFALGVRNTSATTLTNADGDYSGIAVDALGAPYVSLNTAFSGTSANPYRNEDVALGDAQAMMIMGAQREDALTANTNASGDLTFIKTDSSGRLITTGAPPGETWMSCSGVASGTTDVAIKAAVASNKLYVTSIECTNTAAAVSTQLNIDDAAALAWTMYVSSTALGFAKDSITFPTPLRMAAVNTALNVKPITTSAAVTCCAAGYISTQ